MSLDDGGYTVNISIMAKPEHSICLFYLKSEYSNKHNPYAYSRGRTVHVPVPVSETKEIILKHRMRLEAELTSAVASASAAATVVSGKEEVLATSLLLRSGIMSK